MDASVTTLTLEVGSKGDEDLRRYESLRQRYALPQVQVQVTDREIRVTFEALPPVVDYEHEPTAARALAWVATFERDWGTPLGAVLDRADLRYDPLRQKFQAGPGLLQTRGEGNALSTLADAMGVRAEGVRSFVVLATLTTRQRPDLAPLLDHGASPQESVRSLCELADGAKGVTALRYRDWAFRQSPHDPALAEGLLRSWLALEEREREAEGEPEGVRQVLERAARERSSSCVLLARLDLRAGLLQRARQWADQAVSIGPSSGETWEVLAAVARVQGDEQRMLDALTEWARLGQVLALRHVARMRGTEAVGTILDTWHGPWTRDLVWHRMHQLHQQERLRELIGFLLDHASQIDDAPSLQWAREAAQRNGTLDQLRQDLWSRVRRGQATPVVVAFLAQLCREAGARASLIELAEHHPGAVPREWLADAMLDEGRYDEILRSFQLDDGFARWRLQAMLHLELDGASRFSVSEWEVAGTACCRDDVGRSTLVKLVADLRACT